MALLHPENQVRLSELARLWRGNPGIHAHRSVLFFQAEERQRYPLQQEESEVQERWIQLEEKKRWKDDKRRSPEAEGQGHGGECLDPEYHLLFGTMWNFCQSLC